MSGKELRLTERPARIALPNCPKCGAGTTYFGKLPEIGFYKMVYFYMCKPCSEIVQIAAGHV